MSDHYERLLRKDADNFVLTVAVVADATGRTPHDVAHEAIGDALARLHEQGAFDPDGDDA